jgi:type II secretory pathway pseudopilin PulG
MRIRDQIGFTLIELLIAMGFSVAVLAAVYGFFRAQIHTTKGQESRMEAHEYGLSVLDTMVREIRNTGYFPNNGTPCTNIANAGGIVSATANSFRLVYDTNNDSVCDQDVSFTYDGISRNVLRNGTELTDGNAVGLTFTYYPQQTSGSSPAPYCVSTGTPTGCSGMLSSNFTNVQKVAISVVVETKSKDTGFGGFTTLTMNSVADLRNHGL